ncbi:MAG: methyltransferase domain-containing protein [Verrucomicrobiota bacterium]|nr:methyltransferase domain-containing protein [Verrucomicrobiota bacterium]
MRLSHKLAKLRDPRTFRSARRHLGRIFLTRRFVYRLNAEKIIASMDREKFQSLRERYAVENPGSAWPKYLDLQRWMNINLRRVRDLELDYGPRRDVLDVGSGAGYFLYICKWLGHRPLGLDIDEVPLYPEITRMLGLERIVWRVEAFQPLPDLGRKFDLITAFMICFNNHNRPDLWGTREWEFFLDDAASRLKPGGRIYLEFNPERDGSFFSEELRESFAARGAQIENHTVFFSSPERLRSSANQLANGAAL